LRGRGRLFERTRVLRNRKALVIAGVVLVALVALWLWMRRGSERELNVIDLVDLFPEAEKRTSVASLEAAFQLKDVTVNGEKKHCIFAHPFSRITWKVKIPPNAVVKTSFALQPDVWDKDTDGVQFRVGVSDGRAYEELLSQYVNPRARRSDRRWFTVGLDLSSYAGREVSVIFNTDAGPPGDGNTSYDWAVWGEPRVYSSR
jgi:hypothetical protein